ncbi:hypothetical protein C4J81_05710 [Deltaproteobacteria bacterium Smac51]|nr:hypothetical protein C4J81_05710 [Deltaproteobacteria bacterium Smac51]
MFMYFSNGGGECFVVSLGTYRDNFTGEYDKAPFLAAIEALEAVDDVTLLVIPEAVFLERGLYSVQQAALSHCAKRQNRFAILDTRETVKEGDLLLHWRSTPDMDRWRASCQEFRDSVGILNLSYGAAYTPYIICDPTPAIVVSFADIRSHLVNAKKEGDSFPPLQLETLDPGSKETISNLNAAIADRVNLMGAVENVKEGLVKKVNASGMENVLLVDAIGVAGESAAGGMGVVAAGLSALFKSFMGLEPESDESEYIGADANYLLSHDMSRHTRDQLSFLLPRLKELAAPKESGPDDALEDDETTGSDITQSIKAAIAAIDVANMQKFLKIVQEIINDDLYHSIEKNISRLCDALRTSSPAYRAIDSAVKTALKVQPPSATMAGLYADTDRSRGVWKAPANVSLGSTLGLTQNITHGAQESLNVDTVGGKSINALRSFPGKGFLVWGARTLDGNNLEWRYIPVRRFFIMVEESIRRATASSVFEPNDATLWAKVKAMIDNYLLQKWKDGALMGASPAEAYFVNVGLGSTMTEQDILEGKLIINIGMAVVRPAEFIILNFTHKMNQS